jgi:hypothetical protein
VIAASWAMVQGEVADSALLGGFCPIQAQRSGGPSINFLTKEDFSRCACSPSVTCMRMPTGF